MLPSLPDFLQHILDECDYIVDVSKGKAREEILDDPTLKRAIIRSIEVVGEAVKNLDEDFRLSYPHIEWKKMAKTRDKMIYHYFGIDYDIVWEIVTLKIPPLKDYIEEIIIELRKKK